MGAAPACPCVAYLASRDLLVGRNEKGQLGHGDTKRVEAPRLIEALSHEAIVLAACGRNHTLALTGKNQLLDDLSGSECLGQCHRGGAW